MTQKRTEQLSEPSLRTIARKLSGEVKKRQEEFRAAQPLWMERYPRQEELQMMVNDIMRDVWNPAPGLDVAFYLGAPNGELSMLMSVMLRQDHPLFAAHLHHAEYNRALMRPFLIAATQYTDGFRIDKISVNPEHDGKGTLLDVAAAATEEIIRHQREIREDAARILEFSRRMNLTDAQLQGLYHAMEHVFASVQPGETLQKIDAVAELVYGGGSSCSSLQKMLLGELPAYMGIKDLIETAYPIGRRVWLVLPQDALHTARYIVEGCICKSPRDGVAVEVPSQFVSSSTTVYTFGPEAATKRIFIERQAAKRALDAASEQDADLCCARQAPRI